MDQLNMPRRYGAVARSAHWLTFFMLIGSFSLGFYMTDLKTSPLKLKLFSYHKWLGVTIFVLIVLRLAWRLRVQPPDFPQTMAGWEKRAALATHRLLYLLLLAVPLSGWLMSSAKGFQTVLFGVLPIPDLLHKDKPLGEALEEVHVTLAFLFLGLIALHVLAALKHQFIDRDDVLASMTPGVSRPDRKLR
jgi:cytochrome b561